MSHVSRVPDLAIKECVVELRAACHRPIEPAALDTLVGWLRPNFERILGHIDGAKRWANHGARMRSNARYIGAFADFFGQGVETIGVEELKRAFLVVKADCTVRSEDRPIGLRVMHREPPPKARSTRPPPSRSLRAVAPAPEPVVVGAVGTTISLVFLPCGRYAGRNIRWHCCCARPHTFPHLAPSLSCDTQRRLRLDQSEGGSMPDRSSRSLAPDDWPPALRQLVRAAEVECPHGHAAALRELTILALNKVPSRGVFDPTDSWGARDVLGDRCRSPHAPRVVRGARRLACIDQARQLTDRNGGRDRAIGAASPNGVRHGVLLCWPGVRVGVRLRISRRILRQAGGGCAAHAFNRASPR